VIAPPSPLVSSPTKGLTMAKPKTIKAPKDIDPEQATKPQLVKKLREFARYTTYLESQIGELHKASKELAVQINQQQDFMVKQQAEIMAQDIRKTDELQAVESRLGSIEDAVKNLETFFNQDA
jgi:hypothetical protein